MEGALGYISAEMRRLRAMLKSGAPDAGTRVYNALLALTIAMESNPGWAIGDHDHGCEHECAVSVPVVPSPSAQQAVVDGFATLWTATVRSLAATQQVMCMRA